MGALSCTQSKPDVEPVTLSSSLEWLPPHMYMLILMPKVLLYLSLSLVHGGPGLRQSIVQHDEPDVQPVTRSISYKFLLLRMSDVKPVNRSRSFEFLSTVTFGVLRLRFCSVRHVPREPGLHQSIVQPEEPDGKPVNRSSSLEWLPPDKRRVKPVKRSRSLERLPPDKRRVKPVKRSSSLERLPPDKPDVKPVKRSRSLERLPPDNDLKVLKRSSSYGLLPPHMA